MGNLLILDFDCTLTDVSGQLKVDEIKTLSRLYHLAIASRNDFYVVWQQLHKHSLLHLFQWIMADFRPKHYQIKQILYEYCKKYHQLPEKFYFIDDLLENIRVVSENLPGINTRLYDSQSLLEDLI